MISSIFKAFAISFAWAALAAAQVSTNIVISAEPIEGNTQIITKCEHVFNALVDGVNTAFYDVEINAAATGPNPLIGVVPNFGLGIASLKMKIIDKFSGALSFPQVVLTATSTSNFRQIRSVSQVGGSRPIAFSAKLVGSFGYQDFQTPPQVFPALVSVAQINEINVVRDSAKALTGDCYINATAFGGTYAGGGTVTGYLETFNVAGRLWGSVTTIGSVGSILVDRKIGFDPSENVNVGDKRFRLTATGLYRLRGERLNVVVNGGNPSIAIPVSLIAATGSLSTDDQYAGGIFGSISVSTFVSAGEVGNPAVSANGDFGAILTMTGALPINAVVSPAVFVGRTLRSGGSIVLPDSGLAGQIVINGKGASGGWFGGVSVGAIGIVQVGAGSGVYTDKSADFGGGAVGLVPFKLYEADSTHAVYNPSATNFGFFLDSDLKNINTTNPLKIAFFGPVKVDPIPPAPTPPEPPAPLRPFKVTVAPPNSPLSIDVSSKFQIVPDPTNPRKVKLFAVNPEDHFISATYTVTNNTTGQKMICDLAGSNPPPVDMGAGYQFDLGRDCNGNGIADAIDLLPENNPEWDVDPRDGYIDTCPTNGTFCVADMNGDMVVDDVDFQLFVIAYNTLETIDGDFTGDWLTDDADFQIFQLFYDKLDCLLPWGD
ncbi:MAG: hypothetical protein JNK16_09365 [Phycisphaerales bacterium]|nr:hypothetical protein [Phycisphaerales bacterium]